MRRTAVIIALPLAYLGSVGGCRATEAELKAASWPQARPVYYSDSLAGVRALAISSDGSRLAVLSTLAPFVHVIDTAGKLVAVFGRSGRGPHELRNPADITFSSSGDTLWIADVGARRFVRATIDGSVIGSAAGPLMDRTILGVLEDITFGSPIRIAASTRLLIGGAPAPTVTSSRDLRSLTVASLDAQSGRADTILQIVPSSDHVHEERASLLHEIPLWAACGGSGALAAFDPYQDRLLWLDLRGSLTAVESLSQARTRLREEDMLRHATHRFEIQMRADAGVVDREYAARAAERLVRQGQSTFSAEAPRFTRMLCTEDGSILMQTFSTAGDPRGYGAELLVWKRDEPVARVRLPAGFHPLAQRGLHVWGFGLDSLDIPVIQRLDVTVTTAGKLSTQQTRPDPR